MVRLRSIKNRAIVLLEVFAVLCVVCAAMTLGARAAASVTTETLADSIAVNKLTIDSAEITRVLGIGYAAPNTNYYVPVVSGDPVAAGTGAVVPSAEYWYVNVSSTSTVKINDLYIKPTDLLELASDVTFNCTSGQISRAGQSDAILVCVGNGSGGTLGAAATDLQSGQAAVRCLESGTTYAYYVRGASDWARAQAYCGGWYFQYLSNGDSGRSAFNYANGHAAPIVLLDDVTLTAPDSTYGATGIYYAFGRSLTLSAGANLTLQTSVMDASGKSAEVRIMDGAIVTDSANNCFYAEYSDSYAISGGMSQIIANGSSGAQLNADNDPSAHNSVSRPVAIRGTFKNVNGFVYLIGGASKTNTYINGTSFSCSTSPIVADAYVSGKDTNAQLYVAGAGAKVHVRCDVKEGDAVELSAGTIYVDGSYSDGSYTVYINGSAGSGNVEASNGTTFVSGTINCLKVYGNQTVGTVTNDYHYNAAVNLTGTVSNACVYGVCTLNIYQNSTAEGIVGNNVAGSDYNGNGKYGKVNIPDNLTDVYVKGTFDQVKGYANMGGAKGDGDLTILDAINTTQIKGHDTTHTLNILGTSGNPTDPYLRDLTITGSFGYIHFKDVGARVGNGAYIGTGFKAENSSVAINGASIGINNASGIAKCVIDDSIVTMSGATVYAAIRGVDNARLHVDGSTDSSSYIGLYGNFNQLTGHAYTYYDGNGSDLTINGTTDEYIAELKTDIIYRTYGKNEAVIGGGISAYGDTGMKQGLTLTDACADTTVTIDNSHASGGFKFIAVNDTNSDENTVSVKTAGGTSISVGSTASGEFTNNGIDINGALNATVVNLTTNNIYGSSYGVSAKNTTGMSLAGSDATDCPTNHKTMVGGSGDGLRLIGCADAEISHYNISGAANGATADGTTAALTCVNITDTGDTAIGFELKNGSVVTLEKANVTGKTGIGVEGASTLNLKDAINVTGVDYGVKVSDGTVTNKDSGIYSGGDKGNLIKVTGTGFYALYIVKGGVDLDGYQFDAHTAAEEGIAVYTEDDSDITLNLSYSNNTNNPTMAFIWGSDTGMQIGKNTVATISDYKVGGGTQTVFGTESGTETGGAAAYIFGKLYVSGANEFYGHTYGVHLSGNAAVFSNGRAADGTWTDESININKEMTSSGSGTIYAGMASTSCAVFAEVGSHALIYNYDIKAIGTGASYGIKADASTVYADKTITDITCNITGGGALIGSTLSGSGVSLLNGAVVTVDNMTIKSSGYSGIIDNGFLTLGLHAALAADSSGVATILGKSSADANLYIVPDNKSISAEGSFNSIVGYVTTTNDLLITKTDKAGAYAFGDVTWVDAVSVKGAVTNRDTVHPISGANARHDLVLGPGMVTATLADGSEFASVSTVGTANTIHRITVAGDLNVSNSNMDYGFKAEYADVTFAMAPNGETDYVRNITAAKTGAAGVSAGTGAVMKLGDTVMIKGDGIGLNLTGNAIVTGVLTTVDGITDWAAACDTNSVYTAAAALSVGTDLTANTYAVDSKAISMDGTALLLIKGATVSGNLGLYMKGDSVVRADNSNFYSFDSTNGANNAENAAYIGTTQTADFTGSNFTAGDKAAAVAATSGTVTFSSCTIKGTAVVVSAAATGLDVSGTANVTLAGTKVMGTSECLICVTGQNADNRATLIVEKGSTIQNGDTNNEAAALRLNGYASATMSDSTIGALEGNSVTPAVGVDITADTAVFTLTSGSVLGTTNAVRQTAGILNINGGTLDTTDTTNADTVINSSGTINYNAGTIGGIVNGSGAKFYSHVSGGASVLAAGSFSVAKSLYSNNIFVMSGTLEIDGTDSGTAYVRGMDSASNTLTVTGGTVYLTAPAKAAATSGASLIVNGATAAVYAGGTFSSISVKQGTLTSTAPVCFIGAAPSLTAGSGITATFSHDGISWFSGTLTVASEDKITSLPYCSMSNGQSYLGWYKDGDADKTLISVPYSITGGETLVVKYGVISAGGGSAGYALSSALTNSGSSVSSADAWGGVKLASPTEDSGAKVTFTVDSKTSFGIGAVTAKDVSGKAVTVTGNGDGTYSMTMPSSAVTIGVDYVPLFGTPAATPSVKSAVVSSHRIYLNGALQTIQVYNVNGNNYFKLRDMAKIMNGTSCQFSVSFVSGKVSTTIGEAYEAVGGECAVGEDKSKTCTGSTWQLDVNGVRRYLTCYNIGGNNYFKVRDLGQLFSFGVDYDEAARSVQLTTK